MTNPTQNRFITVIEHSNDPLLRLAASGPDAEASELAAIDGIVARVIDTYGLSFPEAREAVLADWDEGAYYAITVPVT